MQLSSGRRSWAPSWLSPHASWAGRLTRIFSEVVLATTAAMVLTLPISLYHFGQLSLISPVANLFVLPAQPGVMTWGGLATLTGMVLPAVGQVFAWVAWLFLAYTIGLVRIFAGLPFAAMAYSLPPGGGVVIYALIFGLTWLVFQEPQCRKELFDRLGQNPGWYGALMSMGIAVALVIIWATSQPDGRLHVAFLDVGPGDATLIQAPSGCQILVDGDPPYDGRRGDRGRGRGEDRGAESDG